LREAGITTFADILIEARDIAQNRVVRQYQSVIADEYQDFTLVGAQFVRALAAGAPDKPVPDDGLPLLGDAAQRIYAGGWIPAWANLSFSGRSETIYTNYRTRLIVEAASAAHATRIRPSVPPLASAPAPRTRLDQSPDAPVPVPTSPKSSVSWHPLLARRPRKCRVVNERLRLEMPE